MPTSLGIRLRTDYPAGASADPTPEQIDQYVVEKINSLIAESLQQSTNFLPDSGRFDGSNGLGGISSGSFSGSATLSPYTPNGNAASSGGKFVHNNSTNGGSAAAINGNVATLLSALGRTSANEKRYGVEFHILKVVTGGGLVQPSAGSDSINRYLALASGSSAMFAGTDIKTTMSFMLRVVTGSVHFAINAEIDGAAIPYKSPIMSTGWHRAFISEAQTSGYSTAFPKIYATPGSEFLIALPIISRSPVSINNTAPYF